MKRTLYYLFIAGVLASMILAACAPAAAPTEAPAAASGKPLFVAINKSADQQYFIDLQNSFVDTATELGRGCEEVRCQARPEPGCEPGE